MALAVVLELVPVLAPVLFLAMIPALAPALFLAVVVAGEDGEDEAVQAPPISASR